jgi:hypothetical protein
VLRLTLTATEQADLDHTFKTTTDRRLRDRCQAVLMASRGRKRKAIAQDLGLYRTTVHLWLQQYQQRGVAGLLRIPRQTWLMATLCDAVRGGHNPGSLIEQV